MPVKRPQLINGEFYHIYNRGVEKRTIFEEKPDYLRFIESLYEFNDKNWVEIKAARRRKHMGVRPLLKEKLVDICCYCLMPNHFHLLLKQLKEKGISLFMQKLASGYTCYFNLKYERVGSLFQGVFKARQIEKEEDLINLTTYIHLNSLELVEPNWSEERRIRNVKEIIKFLEFYKWSSYLDYIGRSNFPSVINKKNLERIIGNCQEYKKFILEWLKELTVNLPKIEELVIE